MRRTNQKWSVVSGQWSVSGRCATGLPVHFRNPTTDHRPLTTDDCAFTLVELLVVIAIITVVSALAVPLLTPVLDTRRVRESARMLSSEFAAAQSEALARGRSVGVWIERLPNEPNAAIDMFLCEVPPPYSGDSEASTATVSVMVAGPQNNIVTTPGGSPQTVLKYQGLFVFGASDTSWVGLLRPGDTIRFGARGPLYRFSDQQTAPATATIDPTTGLLKPGSPPTSMLIEPADSANLVYNYTTNPLAKTKVTGLFTSVAPAAFSPQGWTTPYQIYRQPVKSSSQPLQLPQSAMLDLAYSGFGNGGWLSLLPPALNTPPSPLVILFNSTGAVDGWLLVGDKDFGAMQPPPGPMHFLIGKREKVSTQHPYSSTSYVYSEDPETQAKKHNFRDLENIWVSINPQSGLITTSEVAELRDQATSTVMTDQQAYTALAQQLGGQNPTADQTLANALLLSRQYARAAQNMGGR